MADVTLTYKGSTIAELSDSGSKTLNTAGKYCEADIALSYVKPGGGGDADGIIDGSITSIYNSTVSRIRPYAFYECSSLESAMFPMCETVEDNAFYRCSGLTAVSFPACTVIGSSAFYTCSGLTAVSFPACTKIYTHAFCHPYNKYIANLKHAYFPETTEISGSYVFCDNQLLEDCIIPKLSKITGGDGIWLRCSALKSIYLPNLSKLPNRAFESCWSLSVATFISCSYIASSAFAWCHSLFSLYLLGSSVASLYNAAIFDNTPIKNSSYYSGVFGSVFVPESLVNAYKAAKYWSSYADRITAYVEE